MKLLLDTHAWLWFVLGDPSLTPTARTLIEDSGNDKFVSPASYWEVAIKVRVGKYFLPEPYPLFVQRALAGQGFLILPVLPSHTALVCSLPFYHRDPFDRLLVAQALSEGIAILSGDEILDAYGVHRLW